MGNWELGCGFMLSSIFISSTVVKADYESGSSSPGDSMLNLV